MAMDTDLERLRTYATVLIDALEAGPLDAPVAACPGWTLSDLGRHMGFIHRWACRAATSGEPPAAELIEGPPADDLLAAWVAAGADDLVTALAGLLPDQPTWHPFPVAKVARVWPRRQAHETMIHAWDAVDATGGALSLATDAAADNVAEYFEVVVPRILMRGGRSAPVGTLAVRFADAGTTLVIRSLDGTSVALDPAGAGAADGEISGRAEDLCLALWGRRAMPGSADGPFAAEWLAFGGN